MVARRCGPDEPTIASMLKEIGYATGGFGKWGCGGRDSTGVPEKHGFDVFFGYYDQVHAHSFYPPYLIRNSEEVVLPGNRGGRDGRDLLALRDHGRGAGVHSRQQGPAVLLLPADHAAARDVRHPGRRSGLGAVRDDDWVKDPDVSQDVKNYAAMVTMVDRNVGKVLDLLRELNLEDNTIVFFTGDNGGQDRFRSDEHPRGYLRSQREPEDGRRVSRRQRESLRGRIADSVHRPLARARSSRAA